jgi:ATP-binding cassette, subfamily B (MDR/TAP), member 1
VVISLLLLILFIGLDGHDVRSLNLRWMRRQIAYINQEPMLFNTTIFENIRYGLSEEGRSKEELRSLVMAAAKSANAHDFILALPNGYENEVGERGLQLSGGQRQRIAIARAIIGCPKILLLDEATSALDAMSESIVQNALESASKGRTTIVIAHHLSTIRKADNIVVMSDGSVVEQGQHDALIMQKGVYASMVEKQHSFDTKQDPYRSKDASKPAEDSIDSEHGAKWEPGVIKRAAVAASSERNEEATDSLELSLWGLTKLVSRLTGPERWIICTGLCCSIIVGLGTPVYVTVHAPQLSLSV